MYTVGELARRFGLSRTTLLYYDSIGLLPSCGRTPAGYRVYSEAECERLERICSYREAGLPLGSIKELLAGANCLTVSLLETRIDELSKAIGKLREQQKGIVRLLLNYQVQEQRALVDNSAWEGIFSAAGFSRYDQWQWHREFEMTDPEKHRMFLESVGAPADRIAAIRSWAQREYRDS